MVCALIIFHDEGMQWSSCDRIHAFSLYKQVGGPAKLTSSPARTIAERRSHGKDVMVVKLNHSYPNQRFCMQSRVASRRHVYSVRV